MQRLEEILDRMKNLTAEEFDQVFECDNEFHEELVKMCGMPRVQKAWKEQYYGNLFAGYEDERLFPFDLSVLSEV